MTVVYGIPNCDKCRKARAWFDSQGADYSFHDLRSDGIDEDVISGWLQTLDSDALLNRRSTTWRGLSEAEKKAAALPPKLTVPMIVFFLPVLFAVILGPAFIQISEM